MKAKMLSCLLFAAFAAVASAGESAPERKYYISVLDFTSADIIGSDRFLDVKNKMPAFPAQCTLNDMDRRSINSVMQGFVRMVDAYSVSRDASQHRDIYNRQYEFDRQKAVDLFKRVVDGEQRPLVIGAEYLSAALGTHKDLISVVDVLELSNAANRVRSGRDFPANGLLQLARAAGVTHVVTATVSDVRTTTRTFNGYGVSTAVTRSELDLIVKLVDLVGQRVVFSGIFTGVHDSRQPVSGTLVETGVYQDMMKDAVAQASDGLYAALRDMGQPEPIPCELSVTAKGRFTMNKPAADILVDGVKVARNGEKFFIAPGNHRLEVVADGYSKDSREIEITSDENLGVELLKK